MEHMKSERNNKCITVLTTEEKRHDFAVLTRINGDKMCDVLRKAIDDYIQKWKGKLP